MLGREGTVGQRVDIGKKWVSSKCLKLLFVQYLNIFLIQQKKRRSISQFVFLREQFEFHEYR